MRLRIRAILFTLAVTGPLTEPVHGQVPRAESSPPVAGLRSVRDEGGTYLRLEGRIPNLCRDKISVERACPERNRVAFTISERAPGGFSCLETHGERCGRTESGTEACTSFEELERDPQHRSHFHVRVEASNPGPGCQGLEIASVQVAISKRASTSDGRTEACATCAARAAPAPGSVARLEGEVRELRALLENQQQRLARLADPSQGPPQRARPPGPPDRRMGGGRPDPRDLDADEDDRPRRPRRPPRRPPMGDGDGLEGPMRPGLGGQTAGWGGGMGAMSLMGGMSPLSAMSGFNPMAGLGGFGGAQMPALSGLGGGSMSGLGSMSFMGSGGLGLAGNAASLWMPSMQQASLGLGGYGGLAGLGGYSGLGGYASLGALNQRSLLFPTGSSWVGSQNRGFFGVGGSGLTTSYLGPVTPRISTFSSGWIGHRNIGVAGGVFRHGR